jgi:hypothetical protein
MAPRKSIFLVSMLIGSFLLLAGCSAGASQPPATATAQTVRIQKLATQMAGAAQAAGEAAQQRASETAAAADALLSRAAAWHVVISDTFDTTSKHQQWTTGTISGTLSSEILTIEGGKYNWTATAREGFVYWTTPFTDSVKTFYLAVDARQINGPTDSDMSLLFHESDYNNFYLFEISSEKKFAVSQLVNNEWQTPIPWSDSDAIIPFETNHIEVIGEDGTFYFYINGRQVGSYVESEATVGSSGVAVALYNKDDTGQFTFDNFELRIP